MHTPKRYKTYEKLCYYIMNILDINLLCYPNFVYGRIIGISVQALLHSNKGSIYFLYPLISSPKMVKQEVLTSVKQIKLFVLKPCVGPPLFSVINKRGTLANLHMRPQLKHQRRCCQVCSEAHLIPWTTREHRTTNTRHR